MINDTDTESNIAEQERRNIEDLGSVETKIREVIYIV